MPCGKGTAIGAGVGVLAGAAVGGYMDYQKAQLRKRLQGTGVSVTRVGNDLILNMPGNVTFISGSAALNGGFYELPNSVTLVLNEYPKTLIEIMGHTDRRSDTACQSPG